MDWKTMFAFKSAAHLQRFASVHGGSDRRRAHPEAMCPSDCDRKATPRRFLGKMVRIALSSVFGRRWRF